MKKRTLVCFLIFTLCVFYSSIPGTVFGQDAEPTPAELAQQVFDKHSATLNRDDIKAILPEVLEGLKAPNVQALLTPQLIALAVASPDLLATQGVNQQFITLLKKDQALKDMLSDPIVQSLLLNPAAIDALAGLLDVGGTPPDPVDPAPPTLSITTSRPITEQSGSFNVVFATTDANKDPVTVTGSISVEPVDAAKYYNIPSGTLTGNVRVTQAAPTAEMPTIPGATVTLTLTANDGTADSSPATFVLTFATVVKPPVKPIVKPIVKPFDPINPVNQTIFGKSRLGGLSLNRVGGRLFLAQLIDKAGLPVETDTLVEPLVEFILAQVPQGFLPKKQIKQILTAQQPFSIFQNEAEQLDFENFGNAITPNPAELIYLNVLNETKYLTSDGLHVYARVPSADVGGVRFSLTGGRSVEGRKVTPEVLQADSIPYTFRLEETLAATNLPAWPALGVNAQLFSSVVLRYSQTSPSGEYGATDMQPIQQEDGSFVWETSDVRIIPGNTYYYFEVKLVEPVTLEVLNREALAKALFSDAAQTEDATVIHTIEGWAMPDPRNLQLQDRGIFDALFTDELRVEIGKVLLSPGVAPIISKILSGEEVAGNEFTNAVPPQQLNKLRNLLLSKTDQLTREFERTFDPLLASVFSVPKVDLESESLWVAPIDSISDGLYALEALVYDSEGNPLDQMQEVFTVDTNAPTADINIIPGENVSSYMDGDVLVVTVAPPHAGELAKLDIMGMSNDVRAGGADGGYLIYQIIPLKKDDGSPLGTWLPLTIDSIGLASDIWDAVKRNLSEDIALVKIPGTDTSIDLRESPLVLLLTALNIPDVQNYLVTGLKKAIGIELSDDQYALFSELLGAAVEDINVIPITYGASHTMTMPIQGDQMPLLVGEYGIRAMGIDTLFNVGSYAAPTRLRIVPPDYDRASVTAVSIGDRNDDGDPNGPYETGTIYSNTLDDVTLTVTVDKRTAHPASVTVQYMDANGDWQDISTLDLNGVQEDAMLPIKWANLTDEVFDDLIMAGDTVLVRAVATNDLVREDYDPVTFEIKLGVGVHLPEVLAIMVDPMSITKTNPDSGAPQGTIVINGYTPVLTGPETESVRFEAKRPEDEDWEVIGIATAGMEFTVEVDDLENPIGPPRTYHQWSIIDVDTTTLNKGDGDTITKDSPGARQDYIFNDITNRYEVVDGYVVVDDNKYEVRAVAISMDKLEWSSDARTNFSVDNVDDVAPRGLTHVSVTNLKAFSDSDKVFFNRPVKVAEDGSHTVGGLVDRHDDAVDSPVVTFTIKPQAPLGTYELVKLVTPDFPENTVRAEVTPTDEEGVFEIAIFDIGTLTDDDELADNDEYVKNGPYMFHALAFDEFENVQEDMSATDGTLITVNVANTRRPAPGVLAITIDDPTPNPDSGAPSGVITFNGYTPNPTSAPTVKIRFEIKRQDDEEWTLVRIDAGMDKRQDALEVELEPILPGIDIAKTKDMEHPYPVAWPETYYKWAVDFDTTFLTDTITADSPAARDHTKDENSYMVRAIAIDGVERVVEGVIADLSIDNIDDVAPLGPTKVEVTSIDAVDSVLEVAEDGSYTVGGLVDKHDDAVNSPVITLTITPTAERRTYDSVRLISTLEDTVIGELTETAEGSGVFEITVDVGTLTDNETYVANGPYMFHALAFDENHPFHPEIVNEQEDMSDTDGSKITVNVANNRRPAPGVLAITVDPATVTNPDSGAPQGTITINGYTPDPTSAPMMQVQFEVKRDADAEWISVGMAEMSEAAVEAELTPIVADFDAAKAKDMVHPYPVTWPEAYHKWSIEVDTTTLEDSINKDNPGARDVSLDNNPYMVRAIAVATDGVERGVEGVTAMFSVDNDDDVAPLGPTNVVATSIDAVEPIFVDNGDGTYTVGGLVDKYDPEVNSPVVAFTITPTAARKTYASVKLLTTLPEGAIIGEITETAEGSGIFTVTIDVGTLMDDDELVHNNRYIEDTYIENPDELVYNPKGEVFTFQLHALAYDKAMPYDDVTAADAMFLEYGNVQADDYEGDEIMVNVENSYRPDPGVIAISVVNSDGMTNPDSGAPQGELTFNVYTYYITSPPTEGIRVEVKRPIDDTWERITGTAVDPVPVDVSDVPGIADLADITGGLVGITQAGTVSGEQSEVGIPTRYMKWTFIVDTRELALEDTVTSGDTIKLDDTIKRGDASQRGKSLDENQYEVRAISLTPKNLDQTEYPQREGVEASFSLDNVDDVPPLGPTNITDIADVAGSIAANEDGSVTVGGIVDPTVPSPIAIFTIQPTADPITYVGGKTVLVQTAPDGTVTETDGSLDEGSITIDVGQLANGMYMYHALVADEFGNVQVQGEADMPSPVITVEVLNIRVSDITDLTVTAVDGESPDRHLLQETIGELQGRFPLKESIVVSFNVNNGSLAVEDLTGVLVDGHEVTFTASSDAANAFSLMADKLSAMVDGWYTPHGRVTKRNGSVTFPLATINLDNTGPMISIETPAEGDTVNDLPTLLAGFGDGDLGSGVSDGSGVSTENTAVVSLARLRPEEVVQDAVPIDVNQSMVEQDIASVVYTRTDKLAGGAYMFTIQVSDILGNIGERTVTFAVEGINPIVVITAPASGQTFDHSPENITGFFAGGGDVSITKFTINNEDVTLEPSDGNDFTYMPAEELGDGDYTVAVEVTDGSGLTAQTSLTFTVELPVPTVAIHSPHAAQVYDSGKPIIAGDFSGAAPIAVTLSIDEMPVEPVVNDNNQFTFTPTEELSDGAHTVVAEVTDANGRTAKTSTDFTIDIPGPTVMIHVPDAGQMYDISRPVIQGEYSGVAAPVSLSLTLDGEVVPAIVGDNEFDYTPVDALDDGEYTLVAEATDANGKTAEATAIFSIRLPVPTVAVQTPEAGQVYDHGQPVITGDFSGADPIVVALSIDGTVVIADVNDNNQFTYTPAEALSDGEHMIAVVVTDANGRTAETSAVFTVDIPGPSVAIHAPAAGQMYNISKPIITGEFSGVAMPVSLSLTLNGEAVVAEVSGNEFTYTPADALDDGEYTLVAEAADANGKTAEATAIFSIRLPVPTVAVQTPEAGQVYDHGQPVITGDFSGAAPIAVALSIDGTVVIADVNDNNQFTYTPAEALSDGEHMIAVVVTDANGRTAETSAVFTVDIPGPSVAIHAPAAGQMYNISKPIITGEFSGVAMPVSLSLTLNGEAVVAEVSGNEFTYTPADALDDGEYTLVAEAADANGKTAEATAIFSIRLPVPTVAVQTPEAGQVYDHGQPVITGDFSGADPIVVALSIDGTVVIADVNDNNQFTYTPAEALSDGEHMIAVVVTDANGRTAETSAVFTVDIPGPSVAIHAPAAGQMYNISKPIITGEFSGVAMPVSLSLTLNGEAVVAEVSGNEFTYTPADALDDGEYTLVAEAADANGKTAEATAIFSIRLPVPTVAVQTPEAGQVYDHGQPVITGDFSGADPIVVALSIDGTVVIADVNDNNQFTYTPAEALSDGEHMIAVVVTDANGRTAETSAVFTVDIPGPSVAIHAPAAGQMYNISKPIITGEFSGVAMPVSLSLTLNGEAVVAEVSGNEFTYTPADALDDGEYTLVAEAADANGKTAEATAIFSIRLPVPTVAVQTPEAGQVYDHGQPVITGDFSGADPIVVALSIDGTVVIADVNDNNQFTYTPAEALSDGEHMIAVVVTDANGRTAETSAVFTVDIPGPSVAIHAPAAGQMYNISKPIITGEFSGVAMPVSLSLTLNGEAVVAEVSGNEFTYTPADALDDGEYTLVAEAADANGKTAEATAIFSIRLPVPTVAVQTPEAGQVYDHGQPVITGDFSGAAPIAVALSIDGTVVIADVNDNNQFTYTPAEALSDGEHMIAVVVTDANGRTAETSAVFTVDIPGPSVAIHAPAAGQMYNISKPIITGEFSGVAMPVSLSLTLNGEAVVAEVSGNEFTYTPADALDDGEYTLVAEAADANGKTAEATAIFSIRLPVPTVAVQTPEAGQVYDHGQPVITGDFSGAAPIAVALSIDGTVVIADVNDNNQFTYTPAEALSDGEHMIAVVVTDANGRTAETSAVFTVDIPGPSVAIHAPAAGQMYNISKPIITGEFSGVAMPVSLSLTLNGEAVVAEVSGNEFTYTPADALDDGEYTLVAEAADANGKTAEATAIFSIRLPVPTVAVQTPEAGQVYDHGQPVITGDFSGAAPIAVALSIDGTVVIADVNDNNQFTYTPAEALSDGEHMIAVVVTDANGRTAETSAVFTVDIPGPSVAIHAPAAGQMYNISKPIITGEFSGVAMPVSLSLTLNGAVVAAEVSGNEFSYTPADALDDGEYTLVAEAADANGKTAEATAIFSIRLPVPTVAVQTPEAGQVYDHGQPVITGDFSGAAPIAVALSIDGTVVIADVNDNNQFTYTPAEALSDGEHMIAVVVTDANGRTAETSAVFTVDIPGPSVAIHAPAAGQMYDYGKPVITGEFSGVGPVELTLTINGADIKAEITNNEFTYTPVDLLDDGVYTLVAEATDGNGKTAMATAVFSVRLPVPTVAVQTPEAGQVYDHGQPVITGDFSGAAPIVVKLSIDGNAVDAVVNENNEFTYTPADALSDGGHMVAVEVTDANGRTAKTSAVFTVDIPGPAVAILSPAPGQTYDDGKPVIRVEYSGMTDVEVTTFTVNGENVEVEPEDNQFAYTPANALETGEYHVVVEVTDENEKTAQAAVVFNVKIDNTPPIISEVSPSGVVKFNQQDVLDEKFGIILSAVITDEQSTISSVQFGVVDFGVTKRPLRSVSAQQIAEGKIEVTESFVPGTHTIRLIATSQGGTTEHSWRLTVEVDKDAPVISSIAPAGTIHAGLPTISVSATDESGVSEITIVVMDSNGEVVEGETQDDDEDRTNAGITRLDFNPEAPLSEGSYSIEVRATDTFGNSSTAKGGFSIDFDTAAPIITSSSPQNGARLMYKHDEEARPVISVTFGDAETGVNANSIRLVIESPKVGGGSQAQPINLSGEQMSATQVIYTPAAPAFPRGFEAPGQYTVTLEVSDNAHQEGNVSDESESARKANTAVYQFTFSVEFSDAPILNKPFNFPNPFTDTTRISFGLTRMSTVSIVIYDTTLRPVRTLRDNVVMPAGNYTGENGIGWDGKTSGGEDLARGIYYCQIIVTDGVEPEYAILKLALTR